MLLSEFKNTLKVDQRWFLNRVNINQSWRDFIFDLPRDKDCFTGRVYSEEREDLQELFDLIENNGWKGRITHTMWFLRRLK